MILTKNKEDGANSKAHGVDLKVTSTFNLVKKTEYDKKMKHFSDEISLDFFNGNYGLEN